MKGSNIINAILKVYINIFMCILLCIILGHAALKLDMKNQRDKIFITINAVVVALLILEIFSIVFNEINMYSSMEVHKVINVMGFSMAQIPSFLMWMFLNKCVDKDREISNKKLVALAMPLIIVVVYSLLSYKFNYIFEITENNKYIRGEMFFISPSASCFYFMINLMFLWKNRTVLWKDELFIFGLCIFIPLILGIIQIKYPVILAIWSSWSIVVSCIYIYILHDKSRKDFLTGLGNRVEYNEYIYNLKRKKHVELSVINIDLDGLKYINDNYGHHEGDETIKVFSKLLRETFARKTKSIRLGGDEFTILIEESNKENIEWNIKVLSQKFDEYNKNMNKPYIIKFSYGIGVYNPEQESIEDLMRRCDDLMYMHKRSKDAYAN